jgi:5-dehydro-2-deoxygluconokinase
VAERARGWPLELGFILDREESLRWAEERGFWTAQCLEEPNSTPLRFMGQDAGLTLRSRPRRRGVKLLVTWDAQGDHQLETLEQARVACRTLGREWILEVLRPDGGRDLLREVGQLRGLSPDYWKLPIPAQVSPALVGMISEDRCCRGVLWLGGAQPLSELTGRLRELSNIPISKGFAVGRTVFEQPFLQNQPEAVADLFEQLVAAWRL